MSHGYAITRPEDNIFLDLGHTPEEAAELLVKSNLINAIDETIQKRKLSQKKAADICHTDQPTLSKVLRGRMESVTIDRLASWLTLLGRSVEIRVKPYRASKKAGRLVTVV
jgi:predicted XRE-type DNA-binding protein